MKKACEKKRDTRGRLLAHKNDIKYTIIALWSLTHGKMYRRVKNWHGVSLVTFLGFIFGYCCTTKPGQNGTKSYLDYGCYQSYAISVNEPEPWLKKEQCVWG